MNEESRSAALDGYEGDGYDLDLGAMRRAVARRKSWIIGTTLVAFAAALAFVSLVKPHYTADSQVLIENLENFFTRPDSAAANPAQPPDDAAVASQIQLLTSRDLARQAISALGLAKNPEFNPHARPGALSRLAALVGLSRSPSSLSEEDQILQTYYNKLTVFQVAKSRVLEIDFTSSDPDLAARAANTIADLYIGVQISAKRQEASEAAASLGKEVASLQARLADAEDKAESFRASSGLLTGANNTTLNDQQLADLNTQLAAARAAQADAEAKAKAIRDALTHGQLDEISDVANNEFVRQISIQRVTLRAQLALQSRTLLPQHPQIKELQAQLADIDQQLRKAALTVARGMENNARIAQTRFENIRATLDQQKRTVGDLGANEVRLRTLDRNAKLISDQLEATTAKYQEAAARETATSTPGDARVISRAIAPQIPTFPRKIPTLIFAVLAGLVLSTAAAIAAELMSAGAAAGERRSADTPIAPRLSREVALAEAERRPVEPARVEVAPPPRPAPLAEPRMAVADARGPMSDIVEEAATISRASERAACVLVLGVTDAAQAGAAAVEIGRDLAGEGRSILVELRRGLLAGSGLDAAEGCAYGLGELAAGDKSFAEVIDRDDESRLHFIVAGSAPARPGDALDVAIEALGETYDHLIVLGAPFGADPLSFAFAGAADLVVLVATGRGSEAKAAEVRAELIRAGAGDVVVLTGARPKEASEQVSAA